MLKVEVKDGHVMGLNIHGDLVEIAMDISCLVKAIHHTTLRANPDAAKEFKSLVQWGVLDGSPVWTGKGELVGGSATVTTIKVEEKEHDNGSV